MEKNIEMDTTILKKNLEITKLTQQIDNMTSKFVNEQITPEMIDTLDISVGLLLSYLPKGEKYDSHMKDLGKLVKHIKSLSV